MVRRSDAERSGCSMSVFFMYTEDVRLLRQHPRAPRRRILFTPAAEIVHLRRAVQGRRRRRPPSGISPDASWVLATGSTTRLIAPLMRVYHGSGLRNGRKLQQEEIAESGPPSAHSDNLQSCNPSKSAILNPAILHPAIPAADMIARVRIGIDARKLHDFGIGTYIRNLLRSLPASITTRSSCCSAAPDDNHRASGLGPNFRAGGGVPAITRSRSRSASHRAAA